MSVYGGGGRGGDKANGIYIHHLRSFTLPAEDKLSEHNILHLKEKPTLEAMADDSFKREFLEAHNQYRKQHQAPELTYNDELCSAAQKWADHMLGIRTLGHSETDDGENVYYFSSSVKKPTSGKVAVDSWYSEIKDYNFSAPGNQPGTGHFTQVVWKSSTELGVGMATDGQTVFVVGQYRPPGNMINAGYYEKNVLPKIE